MAASAVLYRAIYENPRRIAAKADLEHLRAVILHLERDSFSCEWSSTLRSKMVEMTKVAEQLVHGGAANVELIDDEYLLRHQNAVQ